MKIIVKKIDKNPFILKTAPYVGVKEVKVLLKVEEGDNFSCYGIGEIIEIPFLLYINDLEKIINRNEKDEFVENNLTDFSKEKLNEWIKTLMTK